MPQDQDVSIFWRVPNKTTDISSFDAVQRQGKEEEQSLLYNWNTIFVFSIHISLFHQILMDKIKYISQLHHNSSDLN